MPNEPLATESCERCFISMDDDGHYYVVPVARRKEWSDWLAIPSEDEESWIVPDYAYEIGGSFEFIEFADWEHVDAE